MDCDLSAAAHRENPLLFYLHREAAVRTPRTSRPLYSVSLSRCHGAFSSLCARSERLGPPPGGCADVDQAPGLSGGATWALREGRIRWVNSCNTRVSCGLSSAEKVVKVAAPADIFHTPVPSPFLTPPPQTLGQENTILAVITLAASPSLDSCGGAY